MIDILKRGIRVAWLLLMIALLPQSSAAKSGNFPTLDLMVLSSDRIAVLVIESRQDSMYAAPAQVGIQKLRYRVLKSYADKPDGHVLRLDVSKVAGEVDPDILPGDTVLWLREIAIDRGPYGEDTLRWDHVFDLSDLRRTRLEYPLTRDFRVLHDGPSILQVVSRRIAMVRSRKPLGDSRYLSLSDFARGKGYVTRWMPPESEAQHATWALSLNTLSYPADADLFAAIMKETYDSDPKVRASAAQALAEYPGDQTVKRLTELLNDQGTRLEVHAGGDTVRAPIVRKAAAESLARLKSPEIVRRPFPY